MRQAELGCQFRKGSRAMRISLRRPSPVKVVRRMVAQVRFVSVFTVPIDTHKLFRNCKMPEQLMTPRSVTPTIASARPEMTAAIMAETGLDERVLRTLVERFYEKVRRDAVLGPIFGDRISDWAPHLDRMVAFWSSVALMTGRYHGRPVPAHARLPVERAHFDRWLRLFRATARETCTPAGAAHVILRAERIARSLRIAVEEARADPHAVPDLR